MQVAIASRIFEPEPSAATFRLGALATALCSAGHDLTVLTVRPPSSLRSAGRGQTLPYRVRRAPVLRDSSGYVRGYVQYMSFDIPLFFRILFGRKRDLIIVEPPPTTGLSVRVAAWIRRTPYAYYAADVWSDASSQTGAAPFVVRAVRRIERLAMRGACRVLSVSSGVTERLAELGINANVVTIGNGVNIRAFAPERISYEHDCEPTFVYAGTASEWHGAQVFVDALPHVLAVEPRARLRFIGGGSQRQLLAARAQELGVAHAVSFEQQCPPNALAQILGNCAAAVGSVLPGAGYDFAFPTKLYSAAACGAPMIYAGIGPAQDFLRTEVEGTPLGRAVTFEPREVANAMIDLVAKPVGPERRSKVRQWAAESVSLESVAARAVEELANATRKSMNE